MKKSRKLTIGAVAVLVLGGAYGLSTLNGASNNIDPSKLATVERGVMLRSVVATGKIEPFTKVEISSLLPAIRAARMDPIEALRYE